MTGEFEKYSERTSRGIAMFARATGAICLSYPVVSLTSYVAENQEITASEGVTATAIMGIGIFLLGAARTVDNEADARMIIEETRAQNPPEQQE